jgi:hypothetical protein
MVHVYSMNSRALRHSSPLQGWWMMHASISQCYILAMTLTQLQLVSAIGCVAVLQLQLALDKVSSAC